MFTFLMCLLSVNKCVHGAQIVVQANKQTSVQRFHTGERKSSPFNTCGCERYTDGCIMAAFQCFPEATKGTAAKNAMDLKRIFPADGNTKIHTDCDFKHDKYQIFLL